MVARIRSHEIEEDAVNFFQSIVTVRGLSTYRTITGRDYGIDGLVELFRDGFPTGELIAVQIKGTDSPIEKLKRSEEVSCPRISRGTFMYAEQKRMPLVIAYVSNYSKSFYWDILQECNGLPNKEEIENLEGEKTVRLRFTNHVSSENDSRTMLETIRSKYFE